MQLKCLNGSLESFANLLVSFKELPLKQLRYRYCIFPYRQGQERALLKVREFLHLDMYASHSLADFTCTENGLSTSSTEASLYTSKLKIVEINIMQILQ